jgi:hypothetical protein
MPAKTRAAGRQVFPAWHYPDEVARNDTRHYRAYEQAITELGSAPMGDHDFRAAVLGASQRLYDDELSRRESINTRCGAVLSTGGILGALFVAAGQLGLMGHKGAYNVTDWLVLAVFLVALAYTGVSIAMALAVQGSRRGNVLDPADIARATGPLNPARYEIDLARRQLGYTVKNYEVNNDLMFKLHSAQQCLRNGILFIIVAGMLSPLVR